MPPMKRMPTVMGPQHNFAQVPSVQIERSVFDRSHGYKTTFDTGLLVPVYVDEVLPGDTFHCRMTAFARLTTPIKPLMDNMYLESFFFFVPYRLLWANFVKFMGEQTNPGDSIAYTVPIYNAMPATGFLIGTIWDYLGLPTAGTPGPTVSIPFSALPMRAYALIFNQWFRDENLAAADNVPTTDGPDTGATYATTRLPFKRGKRHDYFTSCLPFLQKGLAVSMPIGSSAPVKTSVGLQVTGAQQQLLIRNAADGLVPTDGSLGTTASGAAEFNATAFAGTGGWYPANLYADLATATASTINDIRLAFQTQRFLERDARGGTRYIELIWSHFRVKSDDARLQRAEYLGGGSTPIVFSPIAQTTQAVAPTNKDGLANLGGTAASIASNHGFTKSFTEHGIVIGIVNVRGDLTYSQGLERFWSRSTRYDFYWPVFAHLGEQSVLSREIYADGTAGDTTVFGYQERYGEYRYKPSKVTGLFRPAAATNIAFWHLSELFAARPTLSQTFIEDQTESILDRCLQVPAEPDIYFDAFFDLRCARPMPVFGVPGLVDHF